MGNFHFRFVEHPNMQFNRFHVLHLSQIAFGNKLIAFISSLGASYRYIVNEIFWFDREFGLNQHYYYYYYYFS